MIRHKGLSMSKLFYTMSYFDYINLIEETLTREKRKPERWDRMGFWVGSRFSNIPFLNNQDLFFVQNIFEHDLCIMC